MPLPTQDQAWPPASVADLLPKMAEYSAWWSGDPDHLRSVYGGGAGGKFHPGFDETGRRIRPAQHEGGVVGFVARAFWGKPPASLTNPRHQLHVPLASDICQASSDLLFAEQPEVKAERPDGQIHPAGQKRVEKLLGDSAWQVLSEGAEVGAALGGVYYRTTVDRELSSTPFLTRVDYDGAVPEFRWGRLVAVTFWRVLREENRLVWRHLERHELDSQGRGLVLHGLYQGTPDALGSARPLADDPATAPLARTVNADQVSTAYPLTPGLCVVHVPNQRPNRLWRKHPVGRDLGRSDLAGVEGLLDALDETYSSWQRDIRLGKARLFVAAAALDDNGPGKGASFDGDREVFHELNVLQRQEATGLPVQAEQFAIRVQEHRETCDDLVKRILGTAGFSASTFGEYSEGTGMTATEVRSRERRTFLTRDSKVRVHRPALRDLLTKLMSLDHALNTAEGANPHADGFALEVVFPDGVVDSQLTRAQTAQALRTAEAASTETLVRLVNPELEDQAVQAEVKRILDERSAGGSVFDDPEEFGRGGAGLTDGADDAEEPAGE